MGFGEPVKKEDVKETIIINTNISIVDNHEKLSTGNTSSETEDSIDKEKLNHLKPNTSFKDETLKNEKVVVLTSIDTSSSITNTIPTDEKAPNLITEKSDDVEIKKESSEKTLENTTEIKPNVHIEKSNSSEDKISLIEKKKQISTTNKKVSLEKSNIDRAANNLSRDFTKEIVVTSDEKTTAKPVKKTTEVIIKEQKESFKNDNISVATTRKKESSEKILENTTEIKPNNDLGKLNSSNNKLSEINIDNQISTMKKEIGSQNTNIAKAANTLFDEEGEDVMANANNFSRDFTKDIVITDYKKAAKPEKKATEVIIKEQKVRFKKDYVSSTRTIKKEEVLVINSIDVSPISIKNNGKYIETAKSNKVDVMRINFQIDNNKYITSGYKEVYILIQSPSGIILNRKGTFEMKNGKELTYTEKTNAYYNNNQLNISMVTDRFIQRIIKGVYTITIYIEGYPVGLEMLELS